MSNRVTTAAITDATTRLHQYLVTAGLVPAEATLTSVNSGAGWDLWLGGDGDLPTWVPTSLGLSTREAFDTLTQARRQVLAYRYWQNDAHRAAAAQVSELLDLLHDGASAGQVATIRTLVADGWDVLDAARAGLKL